MPSNLYQMFGNDELAESVHGITLEFGDAKFHVRRAGGTNLKFQAEVRRATRPLRKQIELDTLPHSSYRAVNIKIFFRAVMIGWDGVTGPSGQPLEFNEANFTKLMTDLPDLFDAIVEACNRASNFREEEIKEDGEALGNLSSGSGSGES